MRSSFYERYGKRVLDLAASGAGVLALSPLFLVVAVLIKLQDRGPVFFKQKRLGKDFQPFYIYKFRTMRVGAEKMGPSVTREGDPRITPLGRFLRKTKMDELPQLFNVLKGEMSLVGPRPEVEKYARYFKKDYKEILKIRPGITDYATLYFRNEEEILKNFEDPEEGYLKYVLPQKIEFYKKYLEDMSFFTDLKLILLTLWRIFRG